MSKSTIQYYGTSCSGCVFNIKVAELKGGCNKTYNHICKKKSIIPISRDMRVNLKVKHSCFVGK